MCLSPEGNSLLTAYINELFMEGQHVSKAEYSVAAFKWMRVQYRKQGDNSLPRTMAALEGYRNLSPPAMRLPTPEFAFYAVVDIILLCISPYLPWPSSASGA